MSEPQTEPRYEIRLRGVLSDRLQAAFPDLEARVLDGMTTLSGTLADQAALHGVLAAIEALGLELVELRRPALSGADDDAVPGASGVLPGEAAVAGGRAS